MDKLYTIKRNKSIKDSDYDEESYRKAINSERIKELIKSDTFFCEFFFNNNERLASIHSSDIIRFQQIDLQNTCASIVEIKDDEIVVKLLDNHYGSILKELLEAGNDNVLAHMRTVALMVGGKIDIMYIITFDIIKCE